MASFEPASFGKYFLVDKIATGGMAEIFKAKTFSHGGFENLVVIKRILGHLSENDDFVEMFVDEAKVSVALQHANIVRVYDFGKVIDNYFIAMECVDGKDVRAVLRKLSKQRRYLPIDFALLIVHETCRGLAYAHGKKDLRGHPFGIVHRDMSPSNVLVSYEGDVKIADFGIAKAEMNTYNTADGVLKGKFEYMSPEQARGDELDERSDLFSLGIIFYEMLTGRRLFKSDSDVATLERIKAADVTPPSAITPRVPADVERVVMKLLSADRDHRYKNAQQVQTDIRGLLPRPPDELRPELHTFLRDLFKEEIAEELNRLESGSAIASAWKQNADESLWDEHNTTATGTLRTNSGIESRKGGMVFTAVAVIAFLVVAGAAAFGTAFVMSGDRGNANQVASLATGTLNVSVSPVARIFVDGELKGEGTTLVLQDLPAGEHALRLEIDGAEAFERTVAVGADTPTTVDHTFELTQADVVAPSPSGRDAAPQASTAQRDDAPSAPAPKVRFTSEPAGATVLVNGERVGTTPTSWSASPGRSYQVELSLAGHESVTGTVSGMERGESSTFQRTLKKVAAKPGTVTVGIIGGGWGNVFIDGTQQKQTAPNKYDLGAGKHEIRVVNPDLGLDYSETITVASGDVVKVNARP